MRGTVIAEDGSARDIEIADAVFAQPYNEALVRQVVVAEMARGHRSPTVRRNRAEVRGGGRKPWRQKGSGRARAGSIRSPLWRGGGVTFGGAARRSQPATPPKINRKMHRGALRSALSELLRAQRMLIVESITLAQSKTRVMADWLAARETRAALILLADYDPRLDMASRNLPNVDLASCDALGLLQLLRHERVIATLPALRRLEAKLA